MELKPQQLERLPLFKKTLRRPQTTRVAAAAQRARRQPRSSWRAVMLALGPPNGIRRCRRRGEQSYNVEGATVDRDDQRLERCAEANLRWAENNTEQFGISRNEVVHFSRTWKDWQARGGDYPDELPGRPISK